MSRRSGTVLEGKKWQHLKDAKALAYSCWQMYEATPTGLSGEYVEYTDYSDPFLPTTTRRVSALLGTQCAHVHLRARTSAVCAVSLFSELRATMCGLG